MLKLRYETDMPVGDQIDCYLSCNVRINKGELKKKYIYIPVPTYPAPWDIPRGVGARISANSVQKGVNLTRNEGRVGKAWPRSMALTGRELGQA